MGNQTIILPPDSGGGPPWQQGQSHRPKRRRKNRDARKKDAEKKKEKETEVKMSAFRKALLWVTLFSIPLAVISSYSLTGLAKLAAWLLLTAGNSIQGMFK